MMNRPHQAGVALVTAILIVALAAVLAASLLKQLNLDISRTQNIMQNEQAYLYTLGSEAAVSAYLSYDTNKYDSSNEDWSREILAPLEGGHISGHLKDLQSKFNLNNLSTAINSANQPADLQRFQRLLTILKLNTELADAVVDWLDTDLQTTIPGGAEDDYYMGLDKPYRAGNTLLASPSELRLIRGFDADTYNMLKEHICVLPEATAININTASKEVIQSLGAGISDADVEAIMTRLATTDDDPLNDQPFEDINDFTNFMKTNTSQTNFNAPSISVSTDYFLLTSYAEIGRGRVTLYSIIHSTDNKGIHAISRSQGAW